MKDIIEKAKRIKHLESVEKELKERAKAIAEEAKQVAYEYQSLKDEVIQEMEDSDLTKVTDGFVFVTMSDSPFSVVISDDAIIPDEYKKEKVVVDIDKKSLIADKPEIDGVDFIQTKKLTIKL